MAILFKIIIIVGILLFCLMTCILSYFKQQLKIEERKIQDGFNQSNK